MRNTRYKVDLSRRLEGRISDIWISKAKSIAGMLVLVWLLYYVVSYPWDKYKNVYLPMVEEIRMKMVEIDQLSEEVAKKEQKLNDISKRFKTFTEIRQQRMPWAGKLFSLAERVPSQVYITEIGLRETKGVGKKKNKTPDKNQSETGIQKTLFIRGLTPPLARGKYLAKIVAFAKEINTDETFTKDFLPMHLNYNKLVKIPHGKQDREMVQFELEAVVRRITEEKR